VNKPDATLFGAEVIQLLIPHRRPLLMVDTIRSFSRTPRVELRASRHISANEDVFAGHFPNLHIWPGVYTIEGLGQTSLLLAILDELDDATQAGLANLQLGYRLHPGFRPGSIDLGSAESRMGFGAAVDIRFHAPVFAGERLDYHVVKTHTVDALTRFDVEAEADGRLVARGTMTGKRGGPLP
jgi:3-hydroxyacyl-[acyl-carrier-protein] dehydratase